MLITIISHNTTDYFSSEPLKLINRRANWYPKKLVSKITINSQCGQLSLYSFFSDFVLGLYLNKSLRVIRLVVFFCLWRCRLVSFHICKASRRSSKFCLPVADLHLSSFFLPRPPSTTPRSCLSRSSSSSSSSSALIELTSRSLAPSYPAFRFTRRRKLAEKEQEKSEVVWPLCSSFFSSSALSAASFFHPPLRADFLRVRATREGNRLFSERPTDTSLITSGLDSCGCLRRAPGRDTGTVAPRSW